MITRTLLPAGLIALLGLVLPGAAAPNEGKRAPDKDDNRLTGVVKSVDAAHGTFTLERLGVDIDEALSQRLKEQGGGGGKGRDGAAKPAKPAKPAAEGAGKTQVVAVSAKSKIYIKFRTSPSVANNVEQSLKDLQKMIGYPVTVEIARNDDPVDAKEVTAWRGAPWRISK